jgi:glycosyltransferase involved in cell wall biosynthesis
MRTQMDSHLHHKEYLSPSMLRNAEDSRPQCALAISRLDTCNGISEYFRRVAVYFRARGTPLDLIVGNLISYPGTEQLIKDIEKSFQRIHVGRRLESGAHVKNISSTFIKMLTRYALKHRGSGCVVNTHSIDGLGLAAIMTSICPKLRVVHTFQLTPSDRNARFLKSAVGRFLIRSNEHVRFHAISSDIAQCLIYECGMNRKRVETIQYGVDTEVFRPPTPNEKIAARNALGVSQNVFVIVVVARLSPVKGHDVLIKALARIPQAAKKFAVLCVGAGDEEWLTTLAAISGVHGAIRFLGHRNPLQALWAADIFVLPSEWEGFPLVGVEAMACALPLVRTDAGGAHEQINEGENGFIVPIGDSEALAARLERLATGSQLLEDMGHASRERAVKLFQLDTQLERTRQFFNSLTDIRSGIADICT